MISSMFFVQNPFVRMIVEIHYEGSSEPLRIYEEFSFNSQGEMTFIEAWSFPVSDANFPFKLLPRTKTVDKVEATPDSDGNIWPDQLKVYRLSTLIPGLGTSKGKPQVANKSSKGMKVAFRRESDMCAASGMKARLADFCKRYNMDFAVAYAEEYVKAISNPKRKAFLDQLNSGNAPKHILQSITYGATLAGEFKRIYKVSKKDVQNELMKIDSSMF